MTGKKIYIKVNYTLRHLAIRHGCKFDYKRKLYYIPEYITEDKKKMLLCLFSLRYV